MRRGREIDRICDFTVLLMITRTKGQVGALRYQSALVLELRSAGGGKLHEHASSAAPDIPPIGE